MLPDLGLLWPLCLINQADGVHYPLTAEQQRQSHAIYSNEPINRALPFCMGWKIGVGLHGYIQGLARNTFVTGFKQVRFLIRNRQDVEFQKLFNTGEMKTKMFLFHKVDSSNTDFLLLGKIIHLS